MRSLVRMIVLPSLRRVQHFWSIRVPKSASGLTNKSTKCKSGHTVAGGLLSVLPSEVSRSAHSHSESVCRRFACQQRRAGCAFAVLTCGCREPYGCLPGNRCAIKHIYCPAHRTNRFQGWWSDDKLSLFARRCVERVRFRKRTLTSLIDKPMRPAGAARCANRASFPLKVICLL